MIAKQSVGKLLLVPGQALEASTLSQQRSGSAVLFVTRPSVPDKLHPARRITNVAINHSECRIALQSETVRHQARNMTFIKPEYASRT
jgi:hypothetical protein